MIITLGFTHSDRANDYSSFTDGYQLGAAQTSYTIAVEGAGTHYRAQEWAEAVFIASNQPGPATDPVVAAIQMALAEQVRVRLRSLSVGDTVTVHGQMLACQPTGWQPIDTPTATALDDEQRQGSPNQADC